MANSQDFQVLSNLGEIASGQDIVSIIQWLTIKFKKKEKKIIILQFVNSAIYPTEKNAFA